MMVLPMIVSTLTPEEPSDIRLPEGSCQRNRTKEQNLRFLRESKRRVSCFYVYTF